jgi:nucleoside-diphosphate-sugar epimerase
VAPDLAGVCPRFVVVALTARPRTEEAYRATYVDGMARALDALAVPPERAVLVSSTAVMPSSARPRLDDETTRAAPGDGPSRMLLAAEDAFHQRIPHGTVLRLSGLYGGSSARLLGQVREGRIDDPHRWTNRIHREDAAAAVVHLLTMGAGPDGLYLGTDDEPAQLGDVAAYLADRLDAPTPPGADPVHGHGRRLSNARLRATGWAPTYASYREGYAGITS